MLARPTLEAPGVAPAPGNRLAASRSFHGIAASLSAMLFCAQKLCCFTLNIEESVIDFTVRRAAISETVVSARKDFRSSCLRTVVAPDRRPRKR